MHYRRTLLGTRIRATLRGWRPDFVPSLAVGMIYRKRWHLMQSRSHRMSGPGLSLYAEIGMTYGLSWCLLFNGRSPARNTSEHF
jgi:hypothetical protein